MDPIQVPIGPITRARAKMFKRTLNVFIQRIWAEESSWRSKGDDKTVVQDWVSVVQSGRIGRPLSQNHSIAYSRNSVLRPPFLAPQRQESQIGFLFHVKTICNIPI